MLKTLSSIQELHGPFEHSWVEPALLGGPQKCISLKKRYVFETYGMTILGHFCLSVYFLFIF